MTDSDNILTATLAELKTYFKGWHQQFYDELHTGVSNSINTLSDTITNLQTRVSNLETRIGNVYNKTESDQRYLLDINGTGTKRNNITYSNAELKIQNNKKNSEAIVNATHAGLLSTDMYETLMQLHDPTNAQGSTAMDINAGHKSSGEWLKTNPVYDRGAIQTDFLEYRTHFGKHTQMVRFGAMRTLNINHQSPQDTNLDYEKYSILYLNSGWSHEDGSGHRYYLGIRIADEDAPLSNAMYSDVANGINLSFITLNDDSGDGHNDYTRYNGTINHGVESGTWLVISGSAMQNLPHSTDAQSFSISFIGSITWIAKNIKG